MKRERWKLHLSVGILAIAAMTLALTPAVADPIPGTDEYPDVAFLARNDVPFDAQTAASMAAQLGAPIFITNPNDLSASAADGISDLNPDVLIVAGGTAAISDAVATEAAEQCDPDCTIDRRFGTGRDETAADLATIPGDYGFDRPALQGSNQVVGDVYVGGTVHTDAITVQDTGLVAGLNADQLDGRDDYFNPDNDGSGSGLDADLLDGMESSDFASSAVADPFLVQLNLNTFVVVAENGPLSVAAFCEDSGDGTPTMAVRVATSVGPAYNEDTSGSFGPADGYIEIGDTSSPGPGEYTNDIDEGTAIAADGGTLYVVSVDGEIKGHGEDIFGQTCTMNGVVNSYTAPAGVHPDAQPS